MKYSGFLSACCLTLFVGGYFSELPAADLDEVRSLIRQGQHTQALAQLESHLADAPEDAAARFLKGVALAEAGRREEAKDVFVAMTRDFPELPEPYNNLAVLRAHDGQLEAARSALIEAIRIHPNYATAHENLGDVYARLAAVAYQQAVSLDRTNTTANTKLAFVNGVSTGRPPAPKASASMPRVETAAAVAMPSRDEVLATLNSWIDAWTSQNVDAYLDHYAPGFIPSRGVPRDEWAERRRKRVGAPAFIEIQVDTPQVSFRDESTARVTFTQSYRSNTYSDRVVKRLDMVKGEGGWKILAERTVN